MLKQVKTETILTHLIRLIPPLSIAVVIAGLVLLSILLKKPDYLLRGQYLAFPIILASLIMIYCKPKKLEHKETIKLHLHISRWNYHLIYLLLYLATIYLLTAYQTHPIAYFLLIGTIAVVILAEILTDDFANNPASILFKITLLAANIIFGQTLKLPLYFGSTDILPHLHWIKILLTRQHITPPMGYYEYFPLYHILNAIGQLLTNLDLQSAYFAVIGLSFLSSIFFIYLIAYKVTHSTNKSLAAALIYSLSSEALFAGMNMVTRVMSYVIFLVMFYLLISKRPGDSRKNILAISLIIPLVFMHQITLVQEVITLGVFLLLELFIYHRSKLFGIVFPIIFTVCFISYWIYVAGPFFEGVLKTIISTTEAVVIPESLPDIPLYMSLTGNLEATIFAFFAIIGVVLLLVKGLEQKEKGQLGVLFALFSFLAMPLFFPGPADFFTALLLSYRIPLMVLPFIIVPTVEGIFYFLNYLKTKPRNIARLSFVLLTIFTFALTTSLTLGNSTDLNLDKLLVAENRKYFTASELSSFDFCVDKTNKDMTAYTDYESGRYLLSYANRNASSSTEIIENPAKVDDGYLLLRSNHLEERGKLIFIAGTTGFAGKSINYTITDFDKMNISKTIRKNNKVYENDSNILYFII